MQSFLPQKSPIVLPREKSDRVWCHQPRKGLGVGERIRRWVSLRQPSLHNRTGGKGTIAATLSLTEIIEEIMQTTKQKV
ncbi:MAG: hypothetical protein NZ772_12325, partial [Cyanobacteria bacterium]|nr:hypothetical protein [Cyanobacteriota bacterium]